MSRIGMVCAAFLWAAPALALAQAQDKTTELERKIDALSQEVEKLKLGSAPSAAAPAWMTNLSLGGYGEFNAESPSRRNQQGNPGLLKKTLDLRRFVLMTEYRFDERFTLRSELEMEHAGTGEGDEHRGEFEVEQAYLDYRHADWFVARAGHMIVPMGLTNLWHEPPVFHGVERPSVEQHIIPSTWHENGAGFWGKAGFAQYQVYALSGLKAFNDGNAPKVDGFSGSEAIRGGRTEGSNSPIEDMAAIARLYDGYRLADCYYIPFVIEHLDERTGYGRGHLRVYLVRSDLEHSFIRFDGLAFFLHSLDEAN